jgi:hypothetical protein
MKLEQIQELAETAHTIELRLMKDFANLVEARGVSYAVSAYVTAMSKAMGAAIAMSKNAQLREVTHEAAFTLIGMAIEEASAAYATDEAIDKASKV